jgi:hypothetical protein
MSFQRKGWTDTEHRTGGTRLSEEWRCGRKDNVDDKRGLGIVSTLEWKTQMVPRMGTGVSFSQLYT